MNWYLVKLVFKIDNAQQTAPADFDEQYRLIEARNEEEAFAKSKIIGVKNEQSFENAEGVLIRWQFIDTAYIKKIDPLSDGVELFSTTHTSEHAREYEEYVHHQAEVTFSRMSPHAVAID